MVKELENTNYRMNSIHNINPINSTSKHHYNNT